MSSVASHNLKMFDKCSFQKQSTLSTNHQVYQLWKNRFYGTNTVPRYKIHYLRIFKAFPVSRWTGLSGKIFRCGQSQIHPHRDTDEREKCVLMLIINLADPEWVAIKCNEPVLESCLCSAEVQNITNLTLLQTTAHGCLLSFISVRNLCFIFLWYNNNLEMSKIGWLWKSNKLQHFQVVFDATNVAFPPVLSVDRRHAITYNRYLRIYQYKYTGSLHRTSTTGLQIFVGDKHTFLPTQKMFECPNKTYISFHYVCDGNIDCAGTPPLDEEGCLCYLHGMNKKCRWLQHNFKQKVTCSPFYFLSLQGTCELYHPFDQTELYAKLPPVFLCKNGLELDHKLTDDLFADCGPNGEDEIHLKELLSHSHSFKCPEPDQLPCIEGHSKCYNISDICTFQLDDYGNLIACRTGGHVENCSHFECSNKFKCPQHFCIPFSYLCDGKWDCPKGKDESITAGCKNHRQCSNQYKCRMSQICIHFVSVCDRFVDCPLQDDEHLCEVEAVECSSNCECVGLSIFCFNAIISNIQKSFQAVNLIRCNIIHNNLLTKLYTAVYVQVILCEIKTVCDISVQLQNAVVFDFASNSLSTIETGCFSNRSNKVLSHILLNKNLIITIHRFAFIGLSSLKVIDLANNLLSHIGEFAFFCSQNIILILFDNNSLAEVDMKAFSYSNAVIMHTENYHICCLIGQRKNCGGERKWYDCCHDLLSHLNITITVIFLSIAILFFSITCIIFSRYTTESQKGITGFELIVLAINFADLSFVSYFVSIWGAHLYYKSIFPIHEQNWRMSVLCYISHELVSNYSLLSPLLLIFSSFSRFVVVAYPMNTKFKQKGFVLKFLMNIFIHLEVIFLFLTVFLWIMNHKLPFKLCFFFIDPEKLSMVTNFVVWILFSCQILAVLLISLLHILLFVSLKESQRKIQQATNARNHSSLILQITTLTCSNFLCWIPCNIIFLTAWFLDTYPIEMVMWATIVIMPLNSLTIPLVFLGTYIRKMKG